MPLAEDLLAVLNDPTYMWSHAIRESSQDSQRLFLTLPLLPKPISVDDLQVAYSSQRFSQAEPFLDSLRVLEDSFITIDEGTQNRRWVRFRNPSLQDFSYQYLNKYSDWLDILISEPVFYEQIISVYEIAMARLPTARKISPGPPPRLVLEEGSIKFSEIRSWVVRHHDYLIGKAISLALSGSGMELVAHDKKKISDKFKELSEVILTFGEPSSEPTKLSLSELIDRALKPADESSAFTIYELLRGEAANLVQRYTGSDAMDILRGNILDKDTWKFSILSLIDEDLGIDSEASMAQWGNDYLAYLEDYVFEMLQSEDFDELDKAIREIGDITSFLEVDLEDSISALERRRDRAPSEEDDSDYERYTSQNSSGDRSSSDSMRELDNIFESFLELCLGARKDDRSCRPSHSFGPVQRVRWLRFLA